MIAAQDNMNIVKTPSPNFSESTYDKIGFQIHKTLGTNSLAWLRNPRSFSSAHCLIARDGTIYELVPLSKRSWSAGRISKPTERALEIMPKTKWGSYVKPGHYLVQIEFECLGNQTFTPAQYTSAEEWIHATGVPVNKATFLTHQDTASFKPDLEEERLEFLSRFATKTSPNKEKIKNEIKALLEQL